MATPSPAAKQPLLVTDCKRPQTVSFQGASWRAVGDRCVTASARGAGSEIGLGGCDGRPLQRWDFFAGDERIRLHGTSLCVTGPAEAIALGRGTHLELQPCGRAGRQRFHFAPGGLIKIEATVDLCLTMAMRHPDLGELSLGTWCERTPRSSDQQFTIAGAVRTGKGRVTVPGVPDDHAPVWVSPCVGGWNEQQWEYWW